MRKYDYDLVVIGGGAGGITSAMLSTGLGKKTLILDKHKFGGECTWSGCVPSKALLHSAKAAMFLKDHRKFGLSVGGGIKVNSRGVMKNVRETIADVYKGETTEYFQSKGIDAEEDADVSFIDTHRIQVNSREITSDKFIITTGSSPFVPPVQGLNKIKYYTNENIFTMQKFPSSMIIMGGGPIGIELASAFNRLGVIVTIIEMAPVILIREDAELAGILAGILKSEGVKILTGCEVVRVEKGKKTAVVYKSDGKEEKISGEALLVAVGRKPNTENLGLERIGVKHDRRGIAVSRYLRTSVKNIYAAGDVVGPYQFSHMANYQAITAVSNAFLPVKKKINYNHVPWCTYTNPEFAHSGMTEDEARKEHGSVKIFRALFSGIDRARTDKTENGIAKIICNKKGKILGIHILGERAGEIMHEAHLAKSLGIPVHKLNSVIHAYPTYSEILKQIGREAYIDKIQNNIFIKLIKAIRGGK